MILSRLNECEAASQDFRKKTILPNALLVLLCTSNIFMEVIQVIKATADRNPTNKAAVDHKERIHEHIHTTYRIRPTYRNI